MFIESVLFCAQQGIALRGHRETDLNDPSTNIGNFRSLVVLQSRHNAVVKQRLEESPQNATWIGHNMQNLMISLLSDCVLAKIKAEVKEACYFTIIADEAKDCSKLEQMSIVLQYVSAGVIHERFVGYIPAEELTASALTTF